MVDNDTPATVAPIVDAKRPVEEWAAARGLMPRWIALPTVRVRTGDGVDRDIPLPPRHNNDFWKFAAAKALRAWPDGAEVLEKDFDAAVHEACHSRIG